MYNKEGESTDSPSFVKKGCVKGDVFPGTNSEECRMKEIIDVYEGPYLGFALSHDDHIVGYTFRKLSSGDFEIYVQEGNRVTGGAFTTLLSKSRLEGKTYEEVVELLPESYHMKEEFLKDEKLKRFLGFA